MAKSKNVIVVGASFAGQKAYHILSRDFNVTLIDANEYFEFTPSALRCVVEPTHAPSVLVSHPPAVKIATVVSIQLNNVDNDDSGGFVTLHNGSKLPFHYLLVCCGSAYPPLIKPVPFPGTPGVDLQPKGTITSRLASFEVAHAQLAQAAVVLVVGGGTVGVELAAEIAGKFGKQKLVTLVSSSSRLLDRLPRRASAAAESWLKAHGVRVLLGDRVENLQEAVAATAQGEAVDVRTREGNSIRADLVYCCVGGAPNTGIFQSLATSMQGSGWEPGKLVPVEPTMQVSGLAGCVFAAGDCTDSVDEKTALSADLSATVAATNICSLEAGKALLRYPVDVCQGCSAVPMVQNVSLYKHTAIMVVSNIVVTGVLPAAVKQLIEWFAVKAAQGVCGVPGVWRAIEHMTVQVACITSKLSGAT